MTLNRLKDYYKNDKRRFREQARDKYRNLSEHERNRYLKTNISKEKKQKQKLKEYQKKIIVKTKKVKRLDFLSIE